jgi:PAS domain S-box-containing protein
MAVASTSPGLGSGATTRERLPREEIHITLFYLVAGSLWILGTDKVLAFMTEEKWDWLQSLKGLAFVFATGLLLYLTLRWSFQRRRRAEEASRLSLNRFELAAKAATDAIYDWDLVTDRIWWSEGFHDLFGYSWEEAEPTFDFWKRQVHPEDQVPTLASVREAVAGMGSTWSCEYRFRRKNGGYAFVQDRGYIMRDEKGRPLRMIGGMSDITERKESHEQLEQSRRQLRALTARLQSLREEERTRISREIHDELGQLLTALKMDLRWLEKRIGEHAQDAALNPMLERAVEASEIADAAIHTVQKIATELRPGTLDNLGLAAALRQEAGRFQERAGVACEISLPDEPLQLPREVATAVFRICQETFTNVLRHAQATRVRLSLSLEGDQVKLEVEDNGKGISSEALASTKSLGLLGMRERAAVLGGRLDLEPGREGGTRVTLRLPRAANETDFWEQVSI